jgi:hypothetical protein
MEEYELVRGWMSGKKRVADTYCSLLRSTTLTFVAVSQGKSDRPMYVYSSQKYSRHEYSHVLRREGS